MNFVADIEAIFLDRLVRAGIRMSKKDDVFARYAHAVSRLIEPRPRKVLRSASFQCPLRVVPGVEALFAKSEKGQDLTAHLSTRIRKGTYSDGAFVHWGVHHFHLGEQYRSDGMVERTDDLVFALLTDEQFLAIDVRAHDAFEDRDLVQIVHDNWPETISRYVDHNVIATTPLSNEQYSALRKKNVNVMMQLKDGTVYLPPGGGAMASGLQTRARIEGDRLMYAIREVEHLVSLKDRELRDTARYGGHQNPEGSMNLELNDEGELLVVIDRQGPKLKLEPLKVFLERVSSG